MFQPIHSRTGRTVSDSLVQAAIGEYDELLSLVKKRKRKLRFFGHVSRSSGKDNPTGHSERKKEKRQTEKEGTLTCGPMAPLLGKSI